MSDLDFKAQVEKIRDASDIVEVVGQYVKLNRRGNQFDALCPFHKEKTPSFKVNPSRQSFYCFGCHTGGDVFSFVQKIEGVDFLHAARQLAQRAGLSVQLTPGGSGAPRDVRERDRLLTVSRAAADRYRAALREAPDADAARAYLADRALEDALEPFELGFSPGASDAMTGWAAAKQVPLEDLEKAGILSRGDRGDWYDRFRGRLLFPVLDDLGQVLGFSGRLLPGDPRDGKTGKYVNSPETPLFRKSRILYGIHRAKRPILDRRTALLCEGQIDVIRCHLEGFDHAVAAQGTAITEDHARLLKRIADEVILVLDGDAAGAAAGLRSIPLLVEAGLTARVAVLPAGDDPDSLLRAHGRDAFADLLHQAEAGMHYLVRVLRDQDPDASADTATLRAAREAVGIIGRAPGAVMQEQLLAQTAEALGLSVDALRRDVHHTRSRSTRRPPRERSRTPEAGAAPAAPPPEELQLLELLVHFPHCIDDAAPVLQPRHFRHAACAALFRVFLTYTGEDDWDLLRECIDEADEVKTLAGRLTGPDAHVFDTDEYPPHQIAQDLIIAIRLKDMKQRLQDLRRKRSEAQGTERDALVSECQILQSDIEMVKRGWDEARPILDVHDQL